MIGRISGKLNYISADHILVDVSGVGYILNVSQTTLANLPKLGNTVSLFTELVVKEDLLVAKNTLSGTPEAKYLTVSFPVYTSPSKLPDFLAVEHALNIKVANITSNIFFKFLLNIIFFPWVY